MELPFSHTEARILKLHKKGLSVESIARKIGRPGPEGEERVRTALKRAGLEENK